MIPTKPFALGENTKRGDEEIVKLFLSITKRDN